MARVAIGVDAGGTSIKGAVVDVLGGSLLSELVERPTPDPPILDLVVEAIGLTVEDLQSVPALGGSEPTPQSRPIGVAVSADVRDGRHTSGVSPHESWVGAPMRQLLVSRIGGPVRLVNDADAAGMAEMRFGGVNKGRRVIVILTVGTWIGSAVFVEGSLLPNSGLGQLPFMGGVAEDRIGGRGKEQRGLGWAEWAVEFSDYLQLIEKLLHPDEVILCGGVVTAASGLGVLPTAPFPIRVTRLGPGAGTIGAAAFAADAPAQASGTRDT